MSGSEYPSRAGRLTALATLAVSATLFATALFGIAAIDPNAGSAAPLAPVPSGESISLDPGPGDRDARDCPWRDRKRDRGAAGDDAPGTPRRSS